MFAEAAEEIAKSELTKTTKANALALLTMAHADTGQAILTWEALGALFDANKGTSRRHLGELHKAGIIHYSTNGDGIVYVNFKAWVRSLHADVMKSAKNVQNSREKDAEKARIHTRVGAPDLTDRLTDSTDPTSNVSQSVTAPPIDERRLTEALLRDIRIPGRDAARIALAHPYGRVRDAVASWWMNRKSAGGKLENSPGIVLYWLNNWPDKPPNHYEPADWHKQDLYLRHRTPDEVAAAENGADEDTEARRRKYSLDK